MDMGNPRLLTGRIAYLDADGGSTGFELFSITAHADGSRTLSAHCEMHDDALVRDALLALDADARPVEAFIRVTEQDRWMGSAHFRRGVTGTLATLSGPDSDVAADLPGEVDYFGTHALLNDGWVALAGGDLAPGESCTVRGATCSHQANGGGVPALMASDAVLTRFADETVTVAAGTFDCQHWTVAYQGHTPIDMWTTGLDAVLVLMSWDHLAGRYELAEMTDSPPR